MPEKLHTALVLGGARSGKSAFAQRLAQRSGEPVCFVATARLGDDEMVARVAAHRATRPPGWRTIEAPSRVGEAIHAEAQGARTILLDCLTLLASNCLLDFLGSADEGERQQDGLDDDTLPPPSIGVPAVDVQACQARLDEEVAMLFDASRAVGAHLILVSGEVGSGIVPEYPLGRVYRDLLGKVNQTVAEAADAVYFVVAGIPIDLKRFVAGEGDWPLKISG